MRAIISNLSGTTNIKISQAEFAAATPFLLLVGLLLVMVVIARVFGLLSGASSLRLFKCIKCIIPGYGMD